MMRLRRTLAVCLCVALLSSCVTSKVEQLRQSGRGAVVRSGESVVVLGRRHRGDRETEQSFNRCVSTSLRDRKLPVYAEQAFVDAMFPWLEPRTAPMSSEGLASLLDEPEIAQRVRATGVRFMVWIDGETEKVDSGGSVGCAISPAGGGCLGFGWWEKESKYEISVWDIEKRAPVGKVSVNASGTSYMPALIIPIPLIARTEAAACEGVASQIGELLAPGGSVAAPSPAPGARKPRT
jgi:hypothetical protein